MRYLPLLAASILLTGCVDMDFGSSDRFQEDFHYSWELQPNGRVSAESFNGRIEIIGWDENKVEITGTKYGSTEHLRDAIKIETHNSPSAVEIRAVRPSTSMGSSGARMTIRVPRQAILDRVSSSNGSIHVDRVASTAHLKTSNGAIEVSNSSGDLDARTSNGHIDVDHFKGSVTLRSSNGRIRTESVAGSVDAETSNGGIDVKLQEASTAPIRLSTSNGSIDLALGESPKADIRAETSNASITLRMPSSASARINADTSNSRVSSEFEVATRFSGDTSKRDHLNGTIGNGGPTVDLATRNGSIRLLKSAGSN